MKWLLHTGAFDDVHPLSEHVVPGVMHASYIFSTLFVVAPPTTGVPFLTYSGVFAVSLWVVVAAVAMDNGGQLSRQPLRRAA